MDKAKGAREKGTKRGKDSTRSQNGTASKLEDLKITKQQSSDWQKLAAVPKDIFEEAARGSPNPDRPLLDSRDSESGSVPTFSESLCSMHQRHNRST